MTRPELERVPESMLISAAKPFSLTDKVTVITGAGSGVGRAMAKLFAEQKARVLIVDMIASRVDDVTTMIKVTGGDAKGLVSDLSRTSEPDRMIDVALKEYGRVDVLCNNAGVMDGARPVADTSDELWNHILATNLDAPFRACRRVIPAMLENGGGVILNTASIAGLSGGRAGAAYTVSKHGLIGLTKNIAATYGSKGIRCNGMVLGAVQTAIGIGPDPSPLGTEMLQKACATMPRVADPSEIANLALFLVSKESSFLNGSCVVIDGGWTAI